MANNFNFQASLKLNSGGFKKGVNQVKSSLAGLKNSFLQVAGALGAGLGLTQFLGTLKTTATELSVAMNTLKNVSYQTKTFKNGIEEVSVEVSNYSENLAFVKKLSKDYAQDLVAVTDNFAKFTAACKKTNLSLEDQRFVFESLTKAAAYYHLSADRTSDMMNAITQMMSKGKVAAEELRRQLGNTLPGAFNMMAAAVEEAGGSTAKLEELMRKGLVTAEKALPRFAAMLNSVTKTAEFDSLQSSMNKFKNAWYEVVETSGAENMFKGLIDGATKALQAISDNIKGIKSAFIGLVTYFGSMKLFTHFEAQGKAFLAEQQRNIEMLEREYARYMTGLGIKGTSPGDFIDGIKAKMSFASPEELINLRKANEALLKAYETKRKLGGVPIMTAAEVAELQRVNAQLDAMIAKTSTATASTSRLKTAIAGFGAAFSKMGQAISTFFKANWVFLLISALVSVADYIRRIVKEAKEIEAISDKYYASIKDTEKAQEAQNKQLQKYLDTVKDTSAEESKRIFALKEINKAMGLIGEEAYTLEKLKGNYDELTEAVKRWCNATLLQAKIQAYASQLAEATTKRAQAQNKLEDRQDDDITPNKWVGTIFGPAGYGIAKGKNAFDKSNDIKNLQNEIAEYTEIIEDAENQILELGATLEEVFGDGGKGSGDEETDLTELYKKYLKAEKELTNQLKEGAITQKEYNDAFDKLVQEYWKNAAATGELALDDITKKFDKGATLQAMEKWYYDLAKNAKDAALKALLKEANEDIAKATIEEIEAQSKLIEEQLDKYLDDEAKKLEKSLGLDMGVLGGDYETSKRGNRNTLFDYGKKGSEKTSEELELTNKWLDEIKEKYGDLIEESNELGFRTEIVQKELDELSQLYQYASKEAATLEAAMNYQKVVENIKEVRKEIWGLAYSGIKDMATSMDRVVKAADTFKETMEDTDATGWEKFMAVFNMITQIVDTAMGLYQTINTIQQLSLKLGGAKIAEQTAYNALLAKELALRMAMKGASDEEIKNRIAGIGALFAEEGVLAGILGLKKKENQASATGIVLKGGEAAASAGAASASAGEAIAGATASGAKMPFPLNLIAIATGIAAVVAALATMSKFAKGGIVGGNSAHGDHNLARVNSGEMILNKAQQGTLFKAISSGSLGGGNVEFKIKGADLVGTINNYSKKISK